MYIIISKQKMSAFIIKPAHFGLYDTKEKALAAYLTGNPNTEDYDWFVCYLEPMNPKISTEWSEE